jgi:glycosyltransferase involved in cell wall biosynthesis
MKIKKNKTIFIAFSLGKSSVSDFFVELSNNLSDNYNVVVFSDKPKPIEVKLNDNIVIIYWPSIRPTKLNDFIFLVKNIIKFNPSMTISNFVAVNFFLISSFLLNVKHRIAWTHTVSTHFPQTKIFQIRKSLIYKLSTKNIANSDATKNDLIHNFYVPANKIKVIPNAVNKPKFFMEDINCFQITYVGRLYHSKGVDVVIRSFSNVLISIPILSLIIAGSGPQEVELKKLTNQLKISHKVNFVGSINKDEVLKLFNKSYCVVVPSKSEAFGLTIIEAMSVQTCVIGANNTGIKEIIKDYKTGLLFETDSVDELTKKLLILIENPELRNSLAENGYNHFLNNYENVTMAKKNSHFFSQLLDG